ncbi:hydrolase, alpha beta fold family protein [Seminavis robusta]|uniref:Hydrolase, alpha beta fold family protein n=1 Tax=Seminavis robusta TaxID=568900 RepID=A0A9N8DNF4_9STRA|nr:hydrolase, alpha beta fold family protein [Seminavis robusta]|eukprot:Sro243_g096750.1 hydrolase, alpha beta fold family protein (402) ;mRNA; f:10057-11262
MINHSVTCVLAVVLHGLLPALLVHAFLTPLVPPASSRATPLFVVANPTATAARDFVFQGHKTYSELYEPTAVIPKKKKCHVILVHGFGCGTLYWRETIQLFQQSGYTVHALDLLGQGKSAKPGRDDGISYSIRLWAQQVDDYARANIPPSSSIVVMGNSLGSMVALTAATGDQTNDDSNDGFIRQSIGGVGMYNCGVGMNSRNVLREFSGVQKVIFTAIFDLLDALVFGNLPLLTYVLDKVVTQELLKNALTNLYQYATDVDERVNDVLVDSFYYPAKDSGSPQALSQIYTNDPGDTPMEVYQRHSKFLLDRQVPIHLVWGDQDPVTPLAGSVGTFFQAMANESDNNVSMDLVTAGHIPFDEVPESNELMLKWLDNLNDGTTTTSNGGNFLGNVKLPFFLL